jgi:hypothetical protein
MKVIAGRKHFKDLECMDAEGLEKVLVLLFNDIKAIQTLLDEAYIDMAEYLRVTDNKKKMIEYVKQLKVDAANLEEVIALVGSKIN